MSEKLFTIVVIIWVYVAWTGMGMMVLRSVMADLCKMQNYSKNTILSAAYELTFWPKVRYDVHKYRKGQVND